MPVNNLHNPGPLEYALEAVDAVSFGQELYPTLPEKAAFLACSIIQNHIFHDGNKRTSLAVCRVYLLLNGFDLELEADVVDQEAMNIAIDVAASVKGREELTEWVAERMRAIE